MSVKKQFVRKQRECGAARGVCRENSGVVPLLFLAQPGAYCLCRLKHRILKIFRGFDGGGTLTPWDWPVVDTGLMRRTLFVKKRSTILGERVPITKVYRGLFSKSSGHTHGVLEYNPVFSSKS